MPEYMDDKWLETLLIDLDLDNMSRAENIDSWWPDFKSDRTYWSLVKCYVNDQDMNN